MKQSIILIFFLFTQIFVAQQVVETFNLSKILDETSGLEMIDNTLVTINDSGNEPILYFMNQKGKIVSKRKVSGFKNTDWEDITKDEEFIYVADMGNNYDTRRDLSIIKIPINENSKQNIAEIKFNYPEQVDFKFNRKSRFDAEALITLGNSLIIFTKNRASKTTDIYKLPKTPGTFRAKKIGSLNTQSIVTGADFDPKTQTLALTSTIDFNNYYVLIVENFSINKSENSNIDMFEIPIGKCQVESIKFIDSKTFWISSEDEKSSTNARLMKLKL